AHRHYWCAPSYRFVVDSLRMRSQKESGLLVEFSPCWGTVSPCNTVSPSLPNAPINVRLSPEDACDARSLRRRRCRCCSSRRRCRVLFETVYSSATAVLACRATSLLTRPRADGCEGLASR